MILSPVALSELSIALAEFSSALRDQPLARRLLGRIVATVPLIDSADIALSQCPRHHRQALDLLARFGLGAADRAPDDGVTWDGRQVAIRMEPSVIIHEVAHYQLAAPSRRHLADFGLGAGPESGDKPRAETDRRLQGVDCDLEEALTSLLGVLWEAELQQPAILAFLEQNWLEGGASPHNLKHFVKIGTHLVRHGFVDSDGRPTEKLRCDDDDRTFLAIA